MKYGNLDYMTLTAALAGFKAGMDNGVPDRDQIIADIQAAMNAKRQEAVTTVLLGGITPQQLMNVPVQRVEVKGPSGRPPRTLDEALQYYGIKSKYGPRGEEIIDFKPSRPSYPFSYRGAKGGRWKDSPEGIQKRFGAVEPQPLA